MLLLSTLETILIQLILADEGMGLSRPDTLFQWLRAFNRLESDIFIARGLFEVGKKPAADSLLQNLSLQYELNDAQRAEIDSLGLLFSHLDGQNLDSLDNAEIDYLQHFARNESSIGGAWAKEILYRYGFHFPITCQLPETLTDRTPTWGHKPEQGNQLLMAPNPSLGGVLIYLPANEITGQLIVSDPIGQTWLRREISADTVIDLSALPAGVYAVRLHAQSGKVYAGKLALHR